jgi:2-dehydropantoate 2-reductase
MRILVIGAGATGGFFGGRLTQAGRDVAFLVRGARAEQLRRDGLQIRSPFGDATVQPKLVSAEELRGGKEPFDLVIVATKAYSLEASLDDFAPAVGADTAILPILNGLRQLDVLDARFGAERVLGGSCRVVGDVDAEGRVIQMSKLGDITFGERSRERTERIERIDTELRGALFDAILAPDVLAAMWQKWYVLASMNIICILARGTIGEVAAAPRGTEFARAAVEECIAIATANGYTPASEPLAAHITRMTEAGSKLTSSMYRDLTKGAAVEADHILGDLLDRGEAHGVDAPLLRAAYVQLKVYERQRSQG